MSLENVRKFYTQLAIDEAFRNQVQNASSKEECRQTIRAAGYDFTTQELEDYTAQKIDSSDDLSEVNKAELEMVLGGFSAFVHPYPVLGTKYGNPPGEGF
jgi:predicted ribosomally synthesized peptide with nif11-like leader